MTVADVLDGIDAHIDRPAAEYGVIGTLPPAALASAVMIRTRNSGQAGMSETAVAYGWWVWITALISGRSRKICRIAGVSDEGLQVPSMTLPSISMDDHIILDHLLIHHAGRRNENLAGRHAYAQVAAGQRYQLITVEQGYRLR